MNKQTYYLLGGALLASTALTTGAQAAVIRNNSGDTAAVPTKFTAIPLAAQVFSPTTTSANTALIGGATGTSASNAILIDFAATLTSNFDVQLNITNAAFTGTQTVVTYSQSTTGSLQAAGTNVCSVQTLPDKILVTGCVASALSQVDAIAIVGVEFTSASALATAGTSISVDGLVLKASSTTTYETITAATIVTSKDGVTAEVAASSTANIDNTATPVFSVFTSTAASAKIGSIHFSATGAYASDLSATFSAVTDIVGTSEVKVSSSSLSDPALKSITVGAQKATAAQFVSGSVSFQIAPTASLASESTDITLTFDGTTGILATTGTNTVSVTPTTTGSNVNTALAAFSGNLASLSRGGLSVELNTVMPTAGEGSTKYVSVLRIANTSPIDAVATVTVKNDSTGATIGSYQTASIAAGGTLQITSTDIETNVAGAAAAGAPAYKVIVTGAFTGYVQNMIWNTVTGIFTDISGFRNGTSTIDP